MHQVSYMAVKLGSLNAQRALKALGANIKTARLKRRIAVKGFAERIRALLSLKAMGSCG